MRTPVVPHDMVVATVGDEKRWLTFSCVDLSGFSLRLRTNEEKRAAAAVFQSSLGQSTLESRIDVAVLADRFDLQRVEVKETRTRVKVLLPKRVLTRININRVRGD